MLDLLLLHQADPRLLDCAEFWTAVAELRAGGDIGAFGVSVYETAEAERILKEHAGEVDAVQLPFNLLDRRFRPLLPRLTAAKIAVFSRSAFLKGMLAAPESEIPDWLAGLRPLRRRLEDIARGLGLTAGEVALLYCVREPGIDSVLIGVRSPEELERNAAALAALPKLASAMRELEPLSVDDRALTDPRLWAAKGFR